MLTNCAEDTACLVLGHRVAFGKVDGQLTAMLDIGALSTNLPISAPRSLLCGGCLSTRWEGAVEAEPRTALWINRWHWQGGSSTQKRRVDPVLVEHSEDR